MTAVTTAPPDGSLALSGARRMELRAKDSRAAQVTLLEGTRPLLGFLLSRDTADSYRVEAFQTVLSDEAAAALAGEALEALRPQLDCAYLIGLFPLPWQPLLAPFGFRFLSERVWMEIPLAVGLPLPDSGPATVRPLRLSTEQVRELLHRSEPGATPAQVAALCESILRGDFGPLIPEATLELAVDNSPAGACIFTLYRDAPLLSHIFVDRALQGRGLAETLLRSSLAALARLSYRRATLSTDAANRPARRLYQRVGFGTIEPHLACSYLPNRRS